MPKGYDGSGLGKTPKAQQADTVNAGKRPKESDVPTGKGGPDISTYRKAPVRGGK